jgi:hypothetical protein
MPEKWYYTSLHAAGPVQLPDLAIDVSQLRPERDLSGFECTSADYSQLSTSSMIAASTAAVEKTSQLRRVSACSLHLPQALATMKLKRPVRACKCFKITSVTCCRYDIPSPHLNLLAPTRVQINLTFSLVDPWSYRLLPVHV